jgi:hypothetical protein
MQVSKVHVIEQLMESLEGSAMEPEQMLATQFRSLVRGLGMTPEKWEQLMDAHMGRHELKHLMDPDMVKLERGNFERALLQPTMSWKMYCKALQFLNVNHATIFTNISTHDGNAVATVMNFDVSK